MAQEQSGRAFFSGIQLIKEFRFAHAKNDEVYPDWSPDGAILLFGLENHAPALWHLATEKMEIRTNSGSFAGPIMAKWAPDSQRIAVAYLGESRIEIQTREQSFTEWEEWAAWRKTNSYFIDGDQNYTGSNTIKWLPDGNEIVIPRHALDLYRIYDVAKAKVTKQFNADYKYFCISPDGKQIVTVGRNGLEIRNIENPEKVIKTEEVNEL